MGVTSPLYNLLYATNPLKKRYVTNGTDDELNSLPDLSYHFSDYTYFGTPKMKADPRFPFTTHDHSKKCLLNFSVWRQCLLEKTGTSYDVDDENAKICKKYYKLAFNTCPNTEWKRYMDHIERDAFVGLFGINYIPNGANPNIIKVNGDYKIVEVINQYEKGKKKYHVGDSLHGDHH